MWSQSVSKCAIFPSKQSRSPPTIYLSNLQALQVMVKIILPVKIFAWKITSCQWNYYAIFFPTLEENQIVIEMNRNSQLHNKKSTESTFNFFLFATTPQNLKKKILAYLFFLLFAPTLIPEAFQIKTVCSKKIITKVLKKLSVNDQNYFLLISHTLERNKPSHSNQFYCKKKLLLHWEENQNPSIFAMNCY